MQDALSIKPESAVVVAGVGLIGGSVAAAIRARFPQTRIFGLGRSPGRLEQARTAGLLDEVLIDSDGVRVPPGSLVVVCLPVDLIADCVRRLATSAAADVVFTDAGSVKTLICSQLAPDEKIRARFVGAHPIAGGEKTGFEHASADLFEGRCCILTPDHSDPAALRRVTAFWSSLGCLVRSMAADEHDRIVAATSHLPHILSAVTSLAQRPEELAYAGSGFRDTTRIAAGDPELWVQILRGNARHVRQAVAEAQRLLASLAEALDSEQPQRLFELLRDAAAIRRQYESSDGADHAAD